jgi:hypothetical protein
MPASARSPKQPTRGPIGGPAAPPLDISAGMPRTMRDDLTGDFLGRGYDQRMRAEDTNLNIYDSPSRGGALLRSTPLDLACFPESGVYNAIFEGGPQDPVYEYTWADYGHESSQTCQNCFHALWEAYHLNTIYLARNNDALFMAGTTGQEFDPDPYSTPYRNLLYVLPPDGSCASASCAWYQVELPNQYPSDADFSHIVRAVSVTSLAAGYVDTAPYLAVGLSDGGVQIYNVGNGTPQLTSTFGGMATGDGSQTPPTALAWDPSGSGLLAIGVISWANEGFFVQVDEAGIVQPNWLTWTHQGTDTLIPSPLCAAFGQRQDGSPVVAFGMSSDGTLRLVDPKATGPETNALAVSSAVGGAIVAVNPIPRFDGTVGGSDYAVSYQEGILNVLAGTGGLLRWDGTSSGLTAQPVSAGSPNTVSPDWNSFREWYPGIKEGRFQVSNTSGSSERTRPISKQSSQPDRLTSCRYSFSVVDHRSESLPDHRLGTGYHFVDDAGGAHQLLGLTDRFTCQQAHLFEVACEFRSWRKSAKPLHGKLLAIKTGLTDHRQLRIRNDLVWRRIVTPFPFPHDAVAQPASRSIGPFRTEDQMASSILDASSDDPFLVLRMGIGLEARE